MGRLSGCGAASNLVKEGVQSESKRMKAPLLPCGVVVKQGEGRRVRPLGGADGGAGDSVHGYSYTSTRLAQSSPQPPSFMACTTSVRASRPAGQRQQRQRTIWSQ